MRRGSFKFSVLMLIHNEERFLRYTLPPVLSISPDQLILIFDRCTDSSKEVGLELISTLGYRGKLDVIEETEEKQKPGWEKSWRLVYLVHLGVSKSINNIILISSADCVLDHKTNVTQKLEFLLRKKIGWVSFGYREYPFNFENWMRNRFHNLIFLKRRLTGIIYAFRKSEFDEVDVEELKTLPIGIDSFLYHTFLKKGLKPVFVNSDCIHLRPRGRERHYLQGFNKYVRGERLLGVLFNSFLYLKPLMTAGFLKARFMGLKKTPYLAKIQI